jgi:polyhydroxybutyrate depolymerase
MYAHKHGLSPQYSWLLLGLMVLLFAACSSGSHSSSSDTAEVSGGDPVRSDSPYQEGGSSDSGQPDSTNQTEGSEDGQVQRISFDLDGNTRSYEMYVPARYTGSSPVPLILDFHGIYSSAKTERQTSGFQTKADAEGFIVVYPEGISGPGGQSWNADTTDQQWYSWANLVQVDDVAFAVKVADDVKSKLNIDAGRVYVTGLSQGGAMALLCAHDRGDIFAAAAVVSAALLKKLENYKPVRPIPVVSFNSYDDQIVSYDGNGFFGLPPIENTVLQWAMVDGCDFDTPSVSSLGLTDPEHPDVEEKLTIYSGSSSGVEVRLYSLHGTHVLYNTNFHGDTVAEKKQYITSLAWDFLKRFTL